MYFRRSERSPWALDEVLDRPSIYGDTLLDFDVRAAAALNYVLCPLNSCPLNSDGEGRRGTRMGTKNTAEERQFLCSRCYEVVPESRIHVIPYFNSDLGAYVTTYRCQRCWLPSLEETRARFAGITDEAEIVSVATFFERYGVFVAEFRRGDPIQVVHEILIRALDLLRSGALRLPIGPTEPK